METITKIVSAASDTLWGEHQQTDSQHGDEPISGVQGKGEAEDPYDAGNREEQPGATSSESNTAPQEPRLDGNSKPTNSNFTTDTVQTDSPNQGHPMSSNQDHGNSSRSGSSQQSSEQRNTNPSSDSEKIPRSALEDPNVNVSEEALKGPQGPARNPTPDSAITDEDLLGKGDASSQDAGGKTHGNKDHAPAGGEQGPMSKMKERLNKVTHIHHHSSK